MALQSMIRGLLVLLLGVLAACERPLYFAAGEVHPLTRLDSAGDFQISGAAHLSSNEAQTYQLAAEMAITRYLAVRASFMQGGNHAISSPLPLGRIQARHLALGSFYHLNNNYKAATWIGYSQGLVTNENVLITNNIFVPMPRRIDLRNQYARLFIEQQLRYEWQGVEFFGVVKLGSSQVYNLSYSDEHNIDGSLQAWQIEQQLEYPHRFFGALALGISAGTENLHLIARTDYVLGGAAGQIGRFPVIFLSTGLSWRLQPRKW